MNASHMAHSALWDTCRLAPLVAWPQALIGEVLSGIAPTVIGRLLRLRDAAGVGNLITMISVWTNVFDYVVLFSLVARLIRIDVSVT